MKEEKNEKGYIYLYRLLRRAPRPAVLDAPADNPFDFVDKAGTNGKRASLQRLLDHVPLDDCSLTLVS